MAAHPVPQFVRIKRIGWDYGANALVCANPLMKNRIHGVAHQFFMPPGPAGDPLPLTDKQVVHRLERNRC